VRDEPTGLVPPIEWGVAGLPMPGQAASGDQHLVHPLPDGALVAVVDGLGHGEEASVIARRAVNVLETRAHEPVEALVKACHANLLGTRGVVMSLAAIDARTDRLSWVGVGNVEGVLLHADTMTRTRRKSLVLRGGVVGSHIPPLRASMDGIAPGDTLVFATDGIRPTFIEELVSRRIGAPRQVAAAILAQHRKQNDDALVVVARYRGRIS
jgi:negative regulator of sigma-B (phosphoserine phosphatase)